VISIQALGADGQPLANPTFDTPASITFPNLDGLPPGSKSLIYSYKHDQGIWAVDGTGTVSADGKVIVSGFVGYDAATALGQIARAALPPGATGDSYRLQLATFTGPYCDVLDLLRGADAVPMALDLPGGVTLLHQDDLLKPRVTVPDFPAWLTVDYIQSDGGFTRLSPWTTDRAKRQTPGAQLVIGDTKKVNFPVGAPFGTDMIVAIASSVPILAAPLPQDYTLKSYLAALTPAFQAAQKANAKISAGVMLVTTKPK